ncbi:Asp-tRNA(Asn)/Glu-tRNA(Gln) amidotransferase subunit GatB [Marinoscillum sp. MHG1-6]|uniref:Asp-tRNA(Asn)/Glu-tRNA(Gln) amidotransferase subunit GatB n=1 Tax=Marinoscillum sp. MHG1-6 TaxID=2959627 RepID=UPI0021572570|nr:Asp-tRNA(Asn)/Glu-tRNA(Gln) amidotransferase subunit GatB [Marinoscillum sp. MHG1-6]
MITKEERAKYDVVVGLEVHAQLMTESKIFSGDGNAFGSQPNTNISTISLGHPGVMPKLNKKAVELAIRMGLACNCKITRFGYFDRKNYFYPDLPKGYQMTQDKTPICVGGYVPIQGVKSQDKVTLNRIHLEEDAGKSIHVDGQPDSLIDLNRAGVPLIEIVTEPEIFSSEAAGAFLTEVRRLVRYLNVCDGNMEEGSLRCDANVSVKLKGETKLGKKVEVKNMNSIKNVMKAIDHEVQRQIHLLEKGESIVSETRTFNPDTGRTSGMRTKEELNDYRYFPEPDLSPLQVSDEWLEDIRSNMPELPSEMKERFKEQYGLNEYDASSMTDQRDLAYFFDAICGITGNYKKAANWLMGPIKSYINEHDMTFSNFPIQPAALASIIALIDEGKISYTAASQQLLPYLFENPLEDAADAAHKLNIWQESDSGSIQSIVDEILASNEDKVKQYRNGKKGLIGMFMGELMKKSKGKVDPQMANKLLRESLDAQ